MNRIMYIEDETTQGYIKDQIKSHTKSHNDEINGDLISRSDEIWKDVQGYEELYQVSNLGNVRNKKGKLLKPFKKGKYGHALVGLSKNNKSTKYQVHRLVAIHFIPNTENKPEVCHKDNTLDEKGLLNNSASNLTWGTHKENCEFENTRKRQSENHADFTGENNPNYGKHLPQERKDKMMKERGKQVLQWESGRVIAFYESLRDAERKTGVCWVNIRNVCDGQYKHAGGYEWSYACKPYDVEKVVAELEEAKRMAFAKVKFPILFLIVTKRSLQELVNICFDGAIEIVRKGGAE